MKMAPGRQRKKGYISTLECHFRKIGPLSNFFFWQITSSLWALAIQVSNVKWALQLFMIFYVLIFLAVSDFVLSDYYFKMYYNGSINAQCFLGGGLFLRCFPRYLQCPDCYPQYWLKKNIPNATCFLLICGLQKYCRLITLKDSCIH